MVTIALADDHIPTLKRFADYFKKQTACKVVIEAINGYDLIVKINTLKQPPAIILVDINMPVMDGVAVAYYLRIHHPSVKVIGLSVYSDENSLRDMLLSGADGYIIKGLAETILQQAIAKVVNGDVFIDKRIDISEQQINSMLTKCNKRKNENNFELTPREITFIILNAAMLSYEQIAQTMFVETKTIQTYFDRVSKKLNLHSRHELVVFSLQYGLARVANYGLSA